MKKVGVILTVICMLFSSTFVFADSSISIQAELDVSDFYVNIQADGLAAFSRVTLIAVPEQSLPETVLESGTVAYIEQAEVGVGGTLHRRVAFAEDTKPGYYVIYLIDGNTGNSYVSAPFSYLSMEKIRAGLEALNNAGIDDIKDVLEQYAEDFGLDMTEYETMSEANQEKTAKMFLSVKPANGYTDTANVHSLFGACVAAAALPVSKEPLALLEKYAQYLEIDVSQLKQCTANEQNKALEFLCKKTFAEPKEISEVFAEAIFVGKVSCSDTAGILQKYLLTEYADVLNLNLTSYNSLMYPIKVFSSMLGESVTGYDDAKNKFYAAVQKEASAQASSGAIRPGGSGGGSLSAGGGGYPALPQTFPETVRPVNPENTHLYSDLDSVEWAAEFIELLTERGIVAGDGNGLFRPNDSVTRAEFIKMITSAFGIPQLDEESSFDDVNSGDWYAPYVAAGVKSGIVKGISRSWFGAKEIISREDLTVMCVRAADYAQMSLNHVRDGKPADYELISDYAKEAVESFYCAGIIDGDTDGSFRPQNGATRAEAAKIIARLLQQKEAME